VYTSRWPIRPKHVAYVYSREKKKKKKKKKKRARTEVAHRRKIDTKSQIYTVQQDAVIRHEDTKF
jgi:hypothetical protein